MILVSKEVLSRCRKRLATASFVQKSNPCHEPAGSPKGGQFCSTFGNLSPLLADVLNKTNDWLLRKQAKTKVESAVVFGEDGEPIFNQQGQSNHVSFNGEQVAKMRGGYLTHNHPGTRWPGLSDGDLVMASQAGLKGIFACTEDGSLFGARVPQSSELPGVIPDIRSASEFARSLTQQLAEDALRARLKVTNLGHEFWTNRNELGAAQSYLINAVLHDIGLIDLTVSKWGTTLEKADRMLGGLDKLRQKIKEGIANPPQVPKNSSTQDNLTALRLGQLNSIARGVQKRKELIEDYEELRKADKGNPCHDPKTGKFAPLSVCGMSSANTIPDEAVRRSQQDLKTFQKMFSTFMGENVGPDQDGASAKRRVQDRLTAKFMADDEGIELYKEAVKKAHGIEFTPEDDIFETIQALAGKRLLSQDNWGHNTKEKIARREELSKLIVKEVLDMFGITPDPEGFQQRSITTNAYDIVNNIFESTYLSDRVKTRLMLMFGYADPDGSKTLLGSDASTFTPEKWTKELANRLHTLLPDNGVAAEKAFWERAISTSLYSWVHQWAESSADKNPGSIAMQLAVATEFKTGLSSLRYLRGKEDAYDAAVEIFDTWGKVYRKFVRYQYELTQDLFKKQGIKELYLFRGVGLKTEDLGEPLQTTEYTTLGRGGYIPDSLTPKPVSVSNGPVSVGETTFDLQPASSFAYSSYIASSFMPTYHTMPSVGYGKRSGAVLIAKVPVERILSTAETGWGCKAEEEMVVLGGSMSTKYVAWNTSGKTYNVDMLYKMTAQLTPELSRQAINTDVRRLDSLYRDIIPASETLEDGFRKIESQQPAMVVYNEVVSGEYTKFLFKQEEIASQLVEQADELRRNRVAEFTRG